MKIITIEEHLGGVPVSAHLNKYIAKHAPYTMLAHGKDLPYSPDERLYDLDGYRISDMDKTVLRCGFFLHLFRPSFCPGLHPRMPCLK